MTKKTSQSFVTTKAYLSLLILYTYMFPAVSVLRQLFLVLYTCMPWPDMFPRKNDVCGAMRKGGEDDDSTDQKRSSPHAPAFLSYSSLDPPSLPCTTAEERGNSPFWSPIHFPRTQIASPSPLPSKEPRISPQPFVSPPSLLPPFSPPRSKFPPSLPQLSMYLLTAERTNDGWMLAKWERNGKTAVVDCFPPSFPLQPFEKGEEGGTEIVSYCCLDFEFRLFLLLLLLLFPLRWLYFLSHLSLLSPPENRTTIGERRRRSHFRLFLPSSLPP